MDGNPVNKSQGAMKRRNSILVTLVVLVSVLVHLWGAERSSGSFVLVLRALALNLALALALAPNAAVIFFRWRLDMNFDHEKLIVYQKSIVASVAALLPRLQSPFGSIRDQLLRSDFEYR